MLDMLKDYAAISVGSVQAVSAEVAGLGRSVVSSVTERVDIPVGVPDLGAGVGSAVARGAEVVGGVRAVDLDALASRLGLAKKSELHAVRQQLFRLERRIGDVRRDR